MRRHFLLFILIMVFGTATIASARTQQQSSGTLLPAAQADADGMMISGERWQPITIHAQRVPEAVLPQASDSCTSPSDITTVMSSAESEILSGATIINGMSSDFIDPDLSACFFGTPSSTKGYRSVWYRFIAPTSGTINITAFPNFEFSENYDTVIAIHQGSAACTSLSVVTCNDDANGLLSEVTTEIVQGEMYFIEIVDRNLSINGDAQLNLQIQIEAGNRWESNAGWNTAQAERSRHIMAAHGDNLFVIGGQTVLDESVPFTPIRTPTMAGFNTVNREWVDYAPMPIECDPSGYSNTGAAVINDKIYIPSGYVGDNSTYAGTHCVYDIATDTWSTATNAPWTGGLAPAFPAVIARPSNNTYYVVGGLTGPWLGDSPNTTARPEVFLYSAGSDVWLPVAPSIPGGRYGHTGTLIDDRWLCIAGGIRPETGGSSVLLDNGDCLDLTNTGAGWQATAQMNISRFHAQSAIGPNGEWYVFGGVTSELIDPDDASQGSRLVYVSEIEWYDQANNEWVLLDRRYNLDSPTRAWATGAFVNDYFWVIGGETDTSLAFPGYGGDVVGLVERIVLPVARPAANLYMPIVSLYPTAISGPGTTMATSLPIGPNSEFEGEFSEDGHDYFHWYSFRLDSANSVTMTLSDIPALENYDLFLFNDNKVELASSTLFGSMSESITETLPVGRYHVLVYGKVNLPTVTGDYNLTISAD